MNIAKVVRHVLWGLWAAALVGICLLHDIKAALLTWLISVLFGGTALLEKVLEKDDD